MYTVTERETGRTVATCETEPEAIYLADLWNWRTGRKFDWAVN